MVHGAPVPMETPFVDLHEDPSARSPPAAPAGSCRAGPAPNGALRLYRGAAFLFQVADDGGLLRPGAAARTSFVAACRAIATTSRRLHVLPRGNVQGRR